MSRIHPLLFRQLQKLGLDSAETLPNEEQWKQFLGRIDQAYTEVDQERNRIERLRDISSREMQHLYLRLEEAQRIAGLGNWSYVIPGYRGLWSEECFHIFGDTPTACAPGYRQILRRIPRLERPRLQQAIADALRLDKKFEIELQLDLPNDNIRWVRILGQKTTGNNAAVERLHGTVMDVTKRRLTEQALRESETHFRSVVEQASDSFYIHDAEGRILDVNQHGCDSLGYSREQLLTMSIVQIDVDLSIPELHHLQKQIVKGIPIAVESRHRRKDGTTFPVEIRMGPINISGRQHLLSLVRDVTERKQLQDHIQHLAYHDSLTDLPNRAMFNRHLQHAVAQAQRYHKRLAVLFIDLDRFKNINDTLVHDAGDRLLREMAHRLCTCLHGSDHTDRLDRKNLVARLGGDEFVVLIEDAAGSTQVSQIAHDILAALVKEYMLDGQLVHMTASIGISLFPDDGRNEFSLMKHADIAMYRAKAKGKNTLQFYSAQMDAHAARLLTLESGLRRAIERKELTLHYQPKVNARNGRVAGAEVLVRWQHPELGLVSPVHFIPLAEETGLIVPLSKWVLREACLQNVAWQRQGLPPMHIAVNLSAREFTDDNLLSETTHILQQTGMDPSLLEVEVTESMMMYNTDRTIHMLSGLRTLGISVAVDDFGVGYSSLSHIKQFPLDIIKIDRAFVKDIPGDAADAAIAEAIITMAKRLQIKVVAEGVETAAQLAFLRERGCDEIQGHYFGKPLSAEAFAGFITMNIVHADLHAG